MSYEEKKPGEDVDTLVKVSESGDIPADHIPISEKKLLRKLDRHVLPPLIVLYLMSFLDRSNIGNAVIFGLTADIGLVGTQFNTALAIFYACYIIIEPPSNMILKRSRASVYLTILMVLTGTMGLSMGFVKNFSQLTAVRALLGLAEGGFWPGITFIVTQWYPRREAGYRTCLLFAAAGASGAFGGLLARALEKMNGLGGLEGWRWIFIIEGLITILITAAMYFFIADCPESAKFLTEEERGAVVCRLSEDNQLMPTDFRWRYVRDTLLSPLTYLQGLVQFGSYIGVLSFTTFAPSIVKGMGYTAGTAQLLTVPPYVLGCMSTIVIGYLSDKRGVRYPFLAGCLLTSFAGFMILRFVTSVPAQYVACCLVCIGALPLIPLEVTWNGNNQGGELKRALAIAIQVGGSNSSGFVASFAYLAKDAPRYQRGHAIGAGFNAMALSVATLIAAYMVYQNRRRDRLYGKPEDIIASMSETDIEQEKQRGDQAKWFRYTL
ncbi:hypothetical protein I316_07842 [Kwoniella heveanensis BCC8398]|uniref:Major facilitator superfamily (MFS) profile domain-containing protein n=1 Tax=Kwoniella heveanensis BCC8398 TaxID=1296120 RepID=A0A1B9GHG6_9TREE|nr:hypothetical protein I316_07842 [Kwoniella heveanensis BCC8398]